MVFLKDPIMKIRTFSDELIELKGTVICNANEDSDYEVIVDNVILADTDIRSIAPVLDNPPTSSNSSSTA